MLKKTAKLIARSPWIPNKPTKKQLRFLALQDREAFYGGQVGGGKSDALLMGALMYADVPGYSAIIFRRTYADLSRPGALLDRANEWLRPTPAKWNEQKKEWRFPSGAVLAFGYMDNEKDKYGHQGAAYQSISFDELTQFEESQYTYLLSRLRRLRNSPAPLRMRAASNPGGIGHQWVYERYVINPLRPFVPASLADNPYLSGEEYRENLMELDDITRMQLLEGLWIPDDDTQPFKPDWWHGRNRYVAEEAFRLWNACVGRYAALDTANKAEEHNAYSALTVGDLQSDYTMPLRYVARERLEFPDLVDWTIEELAPFNRDSRLRALIVEDAASGTQLIQTLRRSAPTWLRHLVVAVKPPRGGKPEAYKSAAVWAKRGMMPLPHPSPLVPWLHEYEKELFAVPNSTYADQADSTAMLLNYLEERHGVFSRRWRKLGFRPSKATEQVVA